MWAERGDRIILKEDAATFPAERLRTSLGRISPGVFVIRPATVAVVLSWPELVGADDKPDHGGTKVYIP